MNRFIFILFSGTFLVLLPFTNLAQKSATDYLRYAVEATENQDYTGAIVLCDHSLTLDNRNELAWYHRAYNRFMLGDFTGALADINKSIDLNGNIADAYLLRAEVRLKLGERMSALGDYNRARKLDGSITVAHFAQNLFKFIF